MSYRIFDQSANRSINQSKERTSTYLINQSIDQSNKQTSECFTNPPINQTNDQQTHEHHCLIAWLIRMTTHNYPQLDRTSKKELNGKTHRKRRELIFHLLYHLHAVWRTWRSRFSTGTASSARICTVESSFTVTVPPLTAKHKSIFSTFRCIFPCKSPRKGASPKVFLRNGLGLKDIKDARLQHRQHGNMIGEDAKVAAHRRHIHLLHVGIAVKHLRKYRKIDWTVGRGTKMGENSDRPGQGMRR